MEYTYIVPIHPKASREEREWAWAFTVMAKAAPEWRCHHCGAKRKLDAAHIKSRRQHPESALDPENGIPLCRSCHMKHDHRYGHRPSGRPLGMKHTDATKKLIGLKSKVSHNTPEHLAYMSKRARAQWDRVGRKHTPRACRFCGTIFKPRDSKHAYCAPRCHYDHVKGGKRGLKTGPKKGSHFRKRAVA